MRDEEVAFEESLGADWAHDLDVIEVSLDDRPLIGVWAVAFLVGAVVIGRILFLNVWQGEQYAARAAANINESILIPAPRGLIYDRFGNALAENRAVFSAFLNLREFLRARELQDETIKRIEETIGIPENEMRARIRDVDVLRDVSPLLLKSDLSQSELVQIKGANLPTLFTESVFGRAYPEGEMFSSVLGYIGRVSREDLTRDPDLTYSDLTGKAGVELYYDKELRGVSGEVRTRKNARGAVLGEEQREEAKIGDSLTLTIDGELQKFFFTRLGEGLRALGRTGGAGLAIDPRNGEVLALVSFPAYDSNIFGGGGSSEARAEILASSDKPLFNRVLSGLYPPGSTIKPLVGVAALREEVIAPDRSVFSPGYLDIPNPYDPEHPTRYPDWRYQGDVDLSSAIAQSSNVYFYTVGGGTEDLTGLGISRLAQWWEKFGLGKRTGVDMPGEASGFLPTPVWKEKETGNPWLLGDTYNVSIGQGDLLVTPLQLLNYIAGIANWGVVHKPVVKKGDGAGETIINLSELRPEIAEVRRGMEEAITASLGTAHTLLDLPVAVAGKTGSAQVRNNEEVNAFFVGYMPAEDPEIAILVLVENAPEGSLTAVPITKDVLWWYYWNRIHKSR